MLFCHQFRDRWRSRFVMHHDGSEFATWSQASLFSGTTARLWRGSRAHSALGSARMETSARSSVPTVVPENRDAQQLAHARSRSVLAEQVGHGRCDVRGCDVGTVPRPRCRHATMPVRVAAALVTSAVKASTRASGVSDASVAADAPETMQYLLAYPPLRSVAMKASRLRSLATVAIVAGAGGGHCRDECSR